MQKSKKARVAKLVVAVVFAFLAVAGGGAKTFSVPPNPVTVIKIEKK